jgi:hypothetical protein
MEDPLLQIRGHNPEQFPDGVFRKARKSPPIKSDLPMGSRTKQGGLPGLIEKVTHSLAVHGSGRLRGDFFLVAENAPVRATLVWNKDGYN